MNQNDDENDAVTDAETEFAAIADLVAKHIKPRMITAKGPAPDDPEVPVLVLPTSLKLHPLDEIIDEYRERPRRRKGTASASRAVRPETRGFGSGTPAGQRGIRRPRRCGSPRRTAAEKTALPLFYGSPETP